MPRSFRMLALALSAGLTAAALVVSATLSDARWLAVLGLAWVLLLFGVWIPIPPAVPAERRTIVRTGIALSTVFVALAVQLLRMQVVRGDAEANRVGISPEGEPISNPRRAGGGLNVRRGRILAADNTELAGIESIELGWGRTYPFPAANSLLGYYSPLQYGVAGLEQAFDGELTGQDTGSPFTDDLDRLLHRPRTGSDIVLTIDPTLQQHAVDGLAGRNGAAVVIEVASGRVLAMVGNPSPDPTRIFAGTYDQTSKVSDYWKTLVNAPDRPFIMRAVQGLFVPGSIFKIVTATAVIDEGLATPSTLYTDDGALEISGRHITENNRPDDTIVQWSLEDSLSWSLNVVYAQVGLQVGADALRKYAHAYGFGDEIPFPIPVARSQIEGQEGFLNSPPALAVTAFGQGQLLVTPLQMALVAAGVANGGKIMTPHILDRVISPKGAVGQQSSPDVWRTVMKPDSAQTMIGMMRHAVNIGVASGAYIDGLAVGGKTGTAEIDGLTPHAWFIGFAGTWNDDTPRHAVAVLLENGGSGSIPIGRDLLLTAADR